MCPLSLDSNRTNISFDFSDKKGGDKRRRRRRRMRGNGSAASGTETDTSVSNYRQNYPGRPQTLPGSRNQTSRPSRNESSYNTSTSRQSPAPSNASKGSNRAADNNIDPPAAAMNNDRAEGREGTKSATASVPSQRAAPSPKPKRETRRSTQNMRSGVSQSGSESDSKMAKQHTNNTTKAKGQQLVNGEQ